MDLQLVQYLLGREKPSDRVIHEVKLQARVGFAVSERVKHHEAPDTAIKNAAASLHVDVLR